MSETKSQGAPTGYAFGVICHSRAEAAYMIEWCEARGWLPPTLSVDQIAKFPWVACLDFDRNETAWTDHLDRAMEYKTFAGFVSDGYGIDGLRRALLASGIGFKAAAEATGICAEYAQRAYLQGHGRGYNAGFACGLKKAQHNKDINEQ